MNKCFVNLKLSFGHIPSKNIIQHVKRIYIQFHFNSICLTIVTISKVFAYNFSNNSHYKSSVRL